jgi:NAD(P)H-dependent flavin oxidoreductase YrpB (nitropropane dioxygenase family)
VKVWGLVGLARQAQREIEAGIDLIVAQGSDSGGHSGRIGTFSLVPEVVELARETDTPVIAAGGITTGQHLLAALSLGAVGVWSGTIWQATHESEADPHVKRRLVAGKTEDAIQHKFRDGKQMRGLRNKFIEAWQQAGAPEPLPMPLQGMLVAKMLQAIEDWDMDDWKNVPSGQGVGFIRDIKPARQVVFDMMEEAQDAFERLTTPARPEPVEGRAGAD